MNLLRIMIIAMVGVVGLQAGGKKPAPKKLTPAQQKALKVKQLAAKKKAMAAKQKKVQVQKPAVYNYPLTPEIKAKLPKDIQLALQEFFYFKQQFFNYALSLYAKAVEEAKITARKIEKADKKLHKYFDTLDAKRLEAQGESIKAIADKMRDLQRRKKEEIDKGLAGAGNELAKQIIQQSLPE